MFTLKKIEWKLCFYIQPQNEHIELHRKRHGRQLNYHEKKWAKSVQ